MAAALLAGCTGYHPTPVARRGGQLVVALGQDAQSLNPLVAGDVWSVRALTPLYPQLYEAAADLSVYPSLAAALPEISTDGLTWTVRLRAARWSDGRPITADDVVYTVQTEMDPSLDTRATFDWSPLLRVEKVDAATVRFHLSRPDGPFLGDRLLAPIVPQHALQSVALGSMSTALFSTQPPVAGGPFQLEQRAPGLSLELAPNRRYFGAKPYLDGVTMIVLSDPTQLETQIAQGNVGWAPDLPASVAAQLRGIPSVTVRAFPELGRYSLVFNTRAGHPFAAAPERQLVRMDLDHRKIAAAAHGVPVWSGVNAAGWAYDQALGPSRSSISNVNGDVVAADLLYPLGDAARQAAAVEVAQEVAAGGMRLTPRAVPPADLLAKLRSGDFDLALAGLGEGVDPDPALTAASWETPAADPHGQNFAGLSDPELDRLLKQDLALDPSDRAARRPLLDQIQLRLGMDAPYVDLWTVQEFDAFGAGLVTAGEAGPQLDQALQSDFYTRWSLTA